MSARRRSDLSASDLPLRGRNPGRNGALRVDDFAVAGRVTVMRTSRSISIAALLAAATAAVFSVPTVSRAATLISDGSFEGTAVSGFPSNPPYLVPPDYVYVPGGANASASAGPWTYTDPSTANGGGGAGLIANTGSGNLFYGSAPPAGFDGNQFAFLQNGGSFSQTFAATPGAGVISWLEANRPNFGGTESYQVILNNVPLGLGTYVGTSGAFTLVTAPALLLASNTLVFQGLFTNPDSTVFIDEVNAAAATPLPAALPLFAGGLGIIGLLARRRKRNANAVTS